jgi:glycosyltransferase involved in cell wall biosynthesis
MKLVYLTAGAAGMYCGSCMLDNALAKSLIQQGHDCLLVPLYTPIRTDEEDVSLQRVFFGGVNVFLQQKLRWARYLPQWMDSALNQPWLIRKLTANTGKTSPELLGALAISMLRGTDGYQRKEVLRLCDWITREVEIDAIVLTNLLIGGCIPELRRRLNVPVFVILQGDDIFLDALLDRDRRQSIDAMKKLVPQVDGFIVHSQDYGRRMAALLDVPVDRCHVVPLGIDIKEFQQPFEPSNVMVGMPNELSEKGTSLRSERSRFRIGYFARMAPEKGLHMLVDGFIELAKRLGRDRFELHLAGWLGPQHEAYWSEQQKKLQLAGLDTNWSYEGSIDRRRKIEFLRNLDLFSVPTTYQDPKGLFVLEAAAAGVPYLQPNHGAFPELHARLQAGWLFEAMNQNDFNDQLVATVEQFIHSSSTPSETSYNTATGSEKLASYEPRQTRPLETLFDEISIDRMAQRFCKIISRKH